MIISDDIKIVLFDFDDTLVGTIKPKWAEHKFIAQRYYGKTLTDEEIAEHWGKPLKELFRIYYDTEDDEQALAYNITHHEDYPKVLFERTMAVIKHLHEAGKTVGIITANNRFSFDHDLAFHKFPMDLIDYIQSADDTSFHKPDPRVFEPVLAWLAAKGMQPSEVMYVGDGLHDMKAAIGAGFSFLGVETGLVTAEQFTAAEARSIPSVAELLH